MGLWGKKMSEAQSVIMEIRAGTGGSEAALFVADLFKMYKNFALRNKLQLTLLDSAPTTLGGFKQIIFELSGPNINSALANESGVHRVQRVPQTEKSGRVHTSTASVAVLKKATEKDVVISPAELRIEFFRSSGPGGQNVNKRETAVRIIHLPSGTAVTAQTERGQEANKQYALAILRSQILANTKNQESAELQSERRAQIGTSQRAEKIRTYNFPQSRLTDHRLKKSWHNLDDILDGNLKPIIKAFSKSPSQ